MNCSSVINKRLPTDTIIELIPEAEVGEVESHCIGKPKIEECCDSCGKCTYMVEQLVDVRFPITLSTNANVKRCGVVCESSCPPKKCCKNNCFNMRRCCFLIIACCFGLRLR